MSNNGKTNRKSTKQKHNKEIEMITMKNPLVSDNDETNDLEKKATVFIVTTFTGSTLKLNVTQDPSIMTVKDLLIKITLEAKQYKLYDDSILLFNGNTLDRKDTLVQATLIPKKRRKKNTLKKIYVELPIYVKQIRINYQFFSDRFIYKNGVGKKMLQALNSAVSTNTLSLEGDERGGKLHRAKTKKINIEKRKGMNNLQREGKLKERKTKESMIVGPKNGLRGLV
jgi:hypothetical protein